MIYLIAFVAALTGFLFGFDEGIMSGVLSEIQKDFNIDPAQTGFMMGLLPFGAFISSLATGKLCDSLGRLKVLFSIPLIFAFAIFLIISTQSYLLLCFARFLLGVSIGMSVVVSPMYIAETAPTHIRGRLVTCFQLAITIGILCSYLVNLSAVEITSWRWMFATGFIPSGLLFIGIFFLPESPRWLCKNNKKDEALVALKKLYDIQRDCPRLHEELAFIEKNIKEEPHVKAWKVILSKKVRPCVFLGMMLFFFQQLSGINVVIYYAPIIFKEIHLVGKTATLLATVGIGALNVAMTLVAMRWVEKLGRKPLMLLGFIGAAFSLTLIALASSLDSPSWNWVSVAGIFLFIAAFAVSLGPLPWVMMPEIFPLNARGPGSSLSAGSNWIFNTLVVSSFPILVNVSGISITFAIYAIACVLGIFYTLRYVPETKNISLEEIEAHIRSGKPLKDLKPNS